MKGESVFAYVVCRGERPTARFRSSSQELRNWVVAGAWRHRQARRHPLRRQPAEDALRQDHAPPAAHHRARRRDHPGRLDAREPRDPRPAPRRRRSSTERPQVIAKEARESESVPATQGGGKEVQAEKARRPEAREALREAQTGKEKTDALRQAARTLTARSVARQGTPQVAIEFLGISVTNAACPRHPARITSGHGLYVGLSQGTCQ